MCAMNFHEAFCPLTQRKHVFYHVTILNNSKQNQLQLSTFSWDLHSWLLLLVTITVPARQVWFIPLADERAVCRWNCEIPDNCEIPWERVPYLSALEVRSRQGAILIHVYLYLYLYRILYFVIRYPKSIADENIP